MNNITEQQMDTISDVMNALSDQYNFDIYDSDDISQEIFIICCNLISVHTADKGELFPFLMGAAKNRLISLMRSKYGNSSNANYKDRMAIHNKVELNIDDYAQDEYSHLLERYGPYIKENIPAEYKEDFLKMSEGVKIAYNKKYEIINYIKDCMNLVDA